MAAKFLMIKSEYHVKTNMKQEMREMVFNLIPRSEVVHGPTGAHILLISYWKVILKKEKK